MILQNLANIVRGGKHMSMRIEGEKLIVITEVIIIIFTKKNNSVVSSEKE